MRLVLPIGILLMLAACGPSLPPPNTADARYDARTHSVQVTVSNFQPVTAASLVAQDGRRYVAPGISFVSGPHVTYNPPPSIGIGFGGLGISGCCTGFGSSIGVGAPLGGPRPSEVSDQYVASTYIPVPPDYAQDWHSYHVEVMVGGRAMELPAPAPA